MIKSGRRRPRDSALAEDLILSCTGKGVATETAQKAVRALCRYYGGQMAYIPAKKKDGALAENLRRVIADAAGEHDAEKILDRLMTLYGGMQVYFPLERCAFKMITALEIYHRYGKNGVTMNDLAREYNISAAHAGFLWKLGRHEKLKPSMPYLPFLELDEYTNHG
jgi:Mor family transcriptional regulator